jgi:predicted MPP superfamily phosphohydrolase
VEITDLKSGREIWLSKRFDLEKCRRKRQRRGAIVPKLWLIFDELINLFGVFLRVLGKYKKANELALDVKLRHISLNFPNLPEKFDGYRILHLTDLHLDIAIEFEKKIITAIQGTKADLCVITGDFRRDTKGGFEQILEPLKNLISHINVKDGIYATLGNHDTYLMVRPFENMGIRVLTNESEKIGRNGEHIHLTGVDDVHYYYTTDATKALWQDIPGFKIALVHSPELYDVAGDNEYSLYLCGHTHAGQVCLPGGKALITHLQNGKEFYKGLWKYKNMTGFTGSGTGTSGIPVRINSHSEAVIITLHCGK